MNFKLTLGLTLALLVALVLFLFSQRHTTDDTKPEENAGTKLLDPKPTDVVDISYSGFGRDYHFVKEGADWKIVEGANRIDADKNQLESIAQGLASLSYTQKFEPEATGPRSLENTGIAKPGHTIKFSDKDKHTYTISIGKNATGGSFATVNGGKTIYLLDGSPERQLDKKRDEFRNTQVVQVDQTAVKSISLTTGTATWRITRPAEKWVVDQPVSARANEAVVTQMLRDLQNIRAIRFSTLPKSKERGLDPPVTTITISTSEPAAATGPATASAPSTAPAAKPIVLEIGYPADITADRKNSPVYASLAGSDTVFVLSADISKSLLKDLYEVRDPAVTPSATNLATDFTVSTDGKPSVSASFKSGKWSITGPIDIKADDINISDYLGDIRSLRAIKFVDGAGDLKSIGLDPPHVKIELTLPGQTQKEVILLGTSQPDPEKGKVTPAMRQGESSVFLLQTADANKVGEDVLLKLRDLEVDKLDASRIRAIAITGPQSTPGFGVTPPATGPATAPAPATTAPAAGHGITLEREGTDWKAQSPSGSIAANDAKISALLASFTPLFASKYTDEKPIEGTPVVTVTLTVLESTLPAATLPATTLPASAPATTSAPATSAATAPATPLDLTTILPNPVGPDAGKLVTRTLKIYKVDPPATASAPATAPATAPAPTYKAVWDHQSPTWTFEPQALLIDQLTKEVYATPPAPATTQPTTTPAP